MRRLAAVVTLVMLVAACASSDRQAAPAQSIPLEEAPAGHSHEAAGGRPAHGQGASGKSARSGRSPGTRVGSDDDAASEDDQRAEGNTSGSSSRRPAAALYPAAGTYVYAQSGSEAFCDPAGNCDRQDLPPTQRVLTTYRRHDDDDALVVQETRSSDGRYLRTSTHFTPDAALVTDVYYKLVYEGFGVSEEYAPDPPVPSIRFPLTQGRAWDATWSAGTSGDYHARVVKTESIDVGDHAVEAFRIDTVTHFHGDYEGKGSVVIWFDPETKAIVRTNGALSLKASYGSYNTTFQTSLETAPGY